MANFEIGEMIAVIEGKKAAYESIIEDYKSDTSEKNEAFIRRMDAKRCLCDELLKEYEARTSNES